MTYKLICSHEIEIYKNAWNEPFIEKNNEILKIQLIQTRSLVIIKSNSQ